MPALRAGVDVPERNWFASILTVRDVKCAMARRARGIRVLRSVLVAFDPRRQRLRSLHAAFVLAAGVVCALRAPASAPLVADKLHPCATNEGPTDAYCGTLRSSKTARPRAGRTIDLKIVVLPALSNDAQPDPLFFLAGGPGQGAAQMARRCASSSAASSPTATSSSSTSAAPASRTRSTAAATTTRCAISTRPTSGAWRGCEMPGAAATPICGSTRPPSRWTISTTSARSSATTRSTSTAVRTGRARRWCICASTNAHVRAMILDGVAPPDMRLPLFFARDAQRALDRLLADCAHDGACRAAVSEPGGAHAHADRAAGDAARAVRLTHPRTGVAEDVDGQRRSSPTSSFRRALLAADLVARAGADRARRARRLPGPAGAGDGQRAAGRRT